MQVYINIIKHEFKEKSVFCAGSCSDAITLFTREFHLFQNRMHYNNIQRHRRIPQLIPGQMRESTCSSEKAQTPNEMGER